MNTSSIPRPRWRRSKRGMLVIGLAAALLLVLIASGETAGNETRESLKVVVSPASMAIPVAEVATRATEVTSLLRTLEGELAPSPEIEIIRKQLPQFVGHIDVLLQGTTEILGDQPPLATLQTQRQIWQGLELNTSRWLKVLTERAVQLRKALDRLQDLQQTWTHTRETAQNSKAPGPINQQIDTVLAALSGAQSPLQAEHSAVLDLQGRVAAESSRCESLLMLIAQAQKQAVGGILVQDGLPIWSAQLWAQAEKVTPARLREIANNCWEDIRQYLTDPSAGMPFHVGLFLVLSLVWWAARGRVARWEAAGGGISVAATVFAHPYAAALFCSIFLATRPGSPAPQTVQALLQIVAILPMIQLTRTRVDPRIVPGLYALGALFAVNTVRQTLDGAPLVGQAILVLEMLTGTLLVGWSLVLGDLRAALTSAKKSARLQALRIGAIFVLFSLAVGLAAGALGFMGLGRLLASEILGGCTMALEFYAYFLVASGVVAFALRVWPLRLLQMVQRHCDLLERRTQRLLVWLTVGGWLSRWLAYMGLLQPALSFGAAILAMNLERGSISISLGDVLIFIITVWVAHWLSAFLRFILNEDVYPRMHIAPGLSYAISSLLHYVILALGVVVGMGLMGMDLSRVTVLAGAFGVGIGFGLQSVVNNFVCGLILLFERPIHVGDMIEVGDLLGEVRRIGIRASVVRTRRGADIIVPNAQLVTDKVTNWTLSDKLRRIELPVSVNYGASPKKVIAVLETVARETPRVLQVPAPRALLMSYGDSSINFELRAWTDEPIYWRQVRSNLAVAVYDAVFEAGMTFPFPQREVRVLKDRPSPEEREQPISNKEPQNVGGG
jgi:potassium-dependent mechanosensitive channel